MSIVNITDIVVLNNPAKFVDPYKFKITFECIAPLEEDVEWKLIYVGSAESTDKDQELDTCMVGPVPVGVNSFEFEANAPDPNQIPKNELVGVTVILLTASYRSKEFVRVGYYVNTEYEDQELRSLYSDSELLTEEMIKSRPDPPIISKLIRNVLAEKPRVTRFKIPWDSANQESLNQADDGSVNPNESINSLYSPAPVDHEAPKVAIRLPDNLPTNQIVPESVS
ncbi:ASF1 like histone chaperone-domain-containing protein [Phakopsora pachyrhizi]|uniref:Anti-silencing function protein 1 n=1 Tax=Phakopsora pachyrhizi TaxID=170000 RepID=A0AAV0B9D1_PHAPC|nr:ASF1 like histone chaperone-domain-containing protein [Phakopsora pachyrhizi]KAI8451930.1 ASF1 like histone chaperone-domain-containing protein [Phakopsora pachyrhizi]CAH7682813.1 ASF1 like histone chaperone-domain-containing protein [Phakopsora pachyrhizi]CAH7690388.1 ASF1 like histone chaperone-domain-containing protein [Phakopsora pachyrhizi]